MMTSQKDQVALVTGAARGIGAAISRELAARGVRVFVNYRSSRDAAEALVADIRAAGGQADALAADVSQEDQVAALFKAIQAEAGRLDILVNNAGMTRDNVIMMLKPDDFDQVISTNLRSAWLCSRAASRTMMKQRSGRIINITSVVGIAGNGGQSNYAASKAGLIGLTKSLAKEIASRGVTVNAVAPGFIETDMTADIGEQMTTLALNAIPLGRIGQPEDIAKAVAFLASDDAAYITGQVLVVDGGMVM
jgi:3-oxoacyl-[acyl-carrier protein] reductase